MSKGRLEQQLAALDELKAGGATVETEAALKKALAQKNNFYVSKVAAAIEQFGFRQLIPDLLATYSRFFSEEDPQCWAKNALVKALGELGHDEPEPYLRGIVHIQMEPVWGGRADTAGTLRGYCALALVGCRALGSLEVLRHLTPVLLDKEKTVRIEAARALARLGREEGALLLRLRALQGDTETEVLGAVFSAIISLERREGVSFVAGFLAGEPEVAEEAILSLGDSRTPEALEVLRRELEDLRHRDLRRPLLTAIALTRLSEATAFLMTLIRRHEPGAAEARQALLDYGAISPEERAELKG